MDDLQTQCAHVGGCGQRSVDYCGARLHRTMMPEVYATQDDVLAELAAAERREGWFAACQQAGRHPVVTCELADALARLLVTRHDVWLGDGCAVLGRGEAWLFRRTDGAQDDAGVAIGAGRCETVRTKGVRGPGDAR